MAENSSEKKVPVMRGPGGRGRMMGQRPKLEHPWKLFGRVLGYIMKRYKVHFVQNGQKTPRVIIAFLQKWAAFSVFACYLFL